MVSLDSQLLGEVQAPLPSQGLQTEIPCIVDTCTAGGSVQQQAGHPPPVTNTAMPARAASSMVADTVVAPSSWRAMTSGRSRRDTLRTACPARASASSCAGVRPTCGTPRSTAMVAGTAPWARTTASTCRAVSRFCGKGMPWLMIVLSRATTALPAASAAATSALITMAAAPTPSCRRAGGVARFNHIWLHSWAA